MTLWPGACNPFLQHCGICRTLSIGASDVTVYRGSSTVRRLQSAPRESLDRDATRACCPLSHADPELWERCLFWHINIYMTASPKPIYAPPICLYAAATPANTPARFSRTSFALRGPPMRAAAENSEKGCMGWHLRTPPRSPAMPSDPMPFGRHREPIPASPRLPFGTVLVRQAYAVMELPV
jgi:hypothetical protein